VPGRIGGIVGGIVKIPNIHRFLFRFEAQRAGHLPDSAGSAWRGAFGHALKASTCIDQRRTDCARCPLRTTCPYACVFEPAPVPNAPRQYQQPAATYVFAPQRGGKIAAGQVQEVELRLLGAAVRYAPLVIHAMNAAGQGGVGSVMFKLDAVQQWHQGDWQPFDTVQPGAADTPPPMPKRIALRLWSPLRLKQQGHYLTPESMTAETLLMSLLRRCYMIHLGNGVVPELDWQQWQQRATTAKLVSADLQWAEVPRNSSRHGRMQAGGVTGSVQLHDVDAAFWPLLWAGQWLHVGHMACMGLGAYRIEAV